jgi:hypothetical protein
VRQATVSEGCEAANTEFEGSTAFRAVTRQRQVKICTCFSELQSVGNGDTATITCNYDR